MSSDAAASLSGGADRGPRIFPWGSDFSPDGGQGRCTPVSGRASALSTTLTSPSWLCEREGLVAALCLRDSENPVRTRVVDCDRAVVVDYQPARTPEKTGVSQIIFGRRRRQGRPNPAGHQSADPGVER